MVRLNYEFKFVILGDIAITLDNYVPDNKNLFDTVKQRTTFYDMQFLGLYNLMKHEIVDSMKAEILKKFIGKVFRGYSALIFPTRSFQITQKLLEQYNRPDIFMYITNQIPIYIMTGDEHDLNLTEEYKELMNKYFVNYGDYLL